MILQAQAHVEGTVLDYENRECSTPREAEEFRGYFERIHECGPDNVRVVSACGRLAIKADLLDDALSRLLAMASS